MNSITFFSTFLLALFAATNALQCKPLVCRMMCENGYIVDAQGCPLCECRETAEVCLEPIADYNCGGFDNQECPSSHECRFSFLGVVGECCRKSSGSSTARTATGTSTSSSVVGATGTSTSRLVKRSVASSTRSATTGRSTARASTRPIGTSTHRLLKRSATSTSDSSSPASTTQNSATTDQSAGQSTSTQY